MFSIRLTTSLPRVLPRARAIHGHGVSPGPGRGVVTFGAVAFGGIGGYQGHEIGSLYVKNKEWGPLRKGAVKVTAVGVGVLTGAIFGALVAATGTVVI